MTHEEIIGFWGHDRLKRWSEHSLRDVNIPESSKQFLREVGLPCKEDWTLRFDAETDKLPPLPSRGNCRQIGFDDSVPLCLDENRRGSVVAVETRTDRFINTSVERFGEFLVLYQEY